VIVKLLRPLFTFQNLFWLLLIALAITVIGGMESLVRGLDYFLLGTVTLGGLVLGWILARIRAPWWLATLIMIGSGFTEVLFLVGQLFSHIWAIAQAIIITLFIYWQQQTLRPLPDTEPILTAGQQFFQSSLVVLTRLWTFLVSLGERGTLDPLPIQIIWGWAFC